MSPEPMTPAQRRRASTGRQPFPIGYRREGYPELMAWRDVVNASERTDTAVRQMRDMEPEVFPEPVAVTSTTPVYLASEIREYFTIRPRTRTVVNETFIRSVWGLRDGGQTIKNISVLLDCSINTVSKALQQPRP